MSMSLLDHWFEGCSCHLHSGSCDCKH